MPASPPPTSQPVGPADSRISGFVLLLIDSFLSQPIDALMPAELMATLIREAALTHLRSAQAEETARMFLQSAQKLLREGGNGALREVLPAPLILALKALIRLPYTPDRGLLTKALSREPFRRLNRELMVGTLLDYSRKVRTSMAEGTAGRSFGALGRLAGEAVKKSTAALTSFAPNMTSAVSDEFERQMQRRAADFADGAVDDLVQRFVTTLTDPKRAKEQEQLKAELLDFVLDLRGGQLAQELDRMQPLTVAAELRATTLGWLESDQAASNLTNMLNWAMAQAKAQAPDGTLGGLLEQIGLVGATRIALQTVLLRIVQPLFESGALLRALT